MVFKRWASSILLGLILSICIYSCQEEPSAIGSGLVDSINFETFTADDFDIIAYGQKFADGFQTNGLGETALGIYNDPVFGTLKTQLLSQVTLSRQDPNFGDETVLDSVVITLPYFSTRLDTDDEGNNTYELDSIFGNDPIKLSMFRSNFFLNNLDPNDNFETPAIYYNNDLATFSGIEGDLLFEDDNFTPSNEEIILVSVDQDDNSTTTRLTPRLRKVFKDDDTLEEEDNAINLAQLAYWTDAIIDKEGEEVLLNQNLFNDYFRGVYFKVEPQNGTGSYIIYDFEDANIELFYSFELDENGTTDEDSAPAGESSNDGIGSIALNFGGVQVLDVNRNFDPNIAQILDNPDTENGVENLYLSGGDVSVAIIDMFGPRDASGVQEQLETLRSCGVIVNEANLILNVNQPLVAPNSGEGEPERLFMFDIDNNRTLVDLAFDTSVGNFGPVDTDINHLGRLERETENDLSSDGVRYKIRITSYINDIINNDSTNVRLAVAVSQNVAIINSVLTREDEVDLEDRTRIPVSSIIAPESTIIHGNLSPDEDKRLKLRLLFTIPEDTSLSDACKALLGVE